MNTPERDRARMAIDDEPLALWEWNVVLGMSTATEGVAAHLGASDLSLGDGSFLAAVHPDDRATVEEALRRAIDPRGRGVIDVELRPSARPDRRVRARGRSFFEGEGDARRAVRLVVAISALAGRTSDDERMAVLARENAHLREASRHATETRQSWLSILSHDLRNPLGVISMGLNLVERDLPTDAPSRRFVASTRRSVRRIEGLIAALLDAGRLLSGRIEIEPSAVEIAPLIVETLDALRPLAIEKGVSLSIDVATPESLRVDIDRDRIAQMTSSLVSSAIESCDRGASIAVRVEAIAGSVEVTLSTSGYGMQEADASHALDPFRAPRTAAGLALQVAKGIVEAHEGHIAFERTLGRGTRIRFSLPIRRGSSRAESPPAHTNP